METFTTKIYSVAFGLAGVGKVDGKVCFVKGALPGEEVDFRITKDSRRFAEGEVVSIKEPSPERVDPVCKYYGRCGGCQGQHISYEEEVKYKGEQASELIKRIARLEDFEVFDIVPSPKAYNYRSSVTLHNNGKNIGFFEIDGKTLMEIDECPIASEAINKEIAKLTPAQDKGDITLKSDSAGRVWSSVRMGERFYIDTFRGVELYLSPRSFSQANRDITVKIIETLEEWIGEVDENTALFDPYCGIGFFTFLLEGDYAIRVGIDENRTAIDCAKTTAKRLGRRDVKFYKGQAEKELVSIFERSKKRDNILFLDPPRKGAQKEILEAVKGLEDVRRVFYLSCDPARLARDVKELTSAGNLSLKRIKPFDMFPRTKHIETLAELERKS